MFSIVPIKGSELSRYDADKELLRTAIMAELDAINLYEQMADTTEHGALKKIFLDVAREEKTHVGEFQALLISLDPQHAEELRTGEQEVMEKTEVRNEAA